MSRLRMEWGGVEEYPIFVYIRFVDHNKWDVEVVKGKKNDQNSGNTSLSAPAWFKYTSNKCSILDVYEEAKAMSANKLKAGAVRL